MTVVCSKTLHMSTTVRRLVVASRSHYSCPVPLVVRLTPLVVAGIAFALPPFALLPPAVVVGRFRLPEPAGVAGPLPVPAGDHPANVLRAAFRARAAYFRRRR